MNDPNPSAAVRAAAAARIKAAREEQGLNLYQLGARAGVNPDTVSRTEKALPNATLETAIRIGAALGLAPFDLVAPLDAED